MTTNDTCPAETGDIIIPNAAERRSIVRGWLKDNITPDADFYAAIEAAAREQGSRSDAASIVRFLNEGVVNTFYDNNYEIG